jgi:hypothetical protein
VPNNGELKTGLFQTHAGVKIVDRDNIPRRSSSRIRLECRGTNSKILIALSDSQVMGDIVRIDKDENSDNRDEKNFPPVRRSTPIISLVFCERERANQDLIRRERASDLFRADKYLELEGRLTANEEEQAGVNDAGENDKNRSDANCRQEKKLRNWKGLAVDETPKAF